MQPVQGMPLEMPAQSNDSHIQMPPDPAQVAKLVAGFLKRTNANTAATYRKQLVDFAREQKATTIEAAIAKLLALGDRAANRRIEAYKLSSTGYRNSKGAMVGRGLSASAVNLRLTVLRSLLKQARRDRLIDWDMTAANVRDELVHDVRGPGEDVLNTMLRLAKAKPGAAGVRDYAILRLAGELGLRRNEIVSLDVDDVDREARELRIRGKGKQQKQSISCSPKTMDAVQAWLAVRPKPRKGSALFTNLIPGRVERLSPEAVYMIVRSLGQAALPPHSRKRISPHKIRHTAITSALQQTKRLGVGREAVKAFSRHKDMRMVLRYIDADDKTQERLANAVGRRLA